MERLTTRNIAGVAVYKHPFECERCGETIWRLPDYGNGSPTEKLAAYEDAEEQGRYGKWIPVSERLPEESLNSVIGWDTYRNRCCFVQYLGGRFVLGDDIDSVNVIAWMPLPEPYRESEPHKQTNADKIRAMSDEELAEFIVNIENHFGEEYEGEQSCLAWLQKESEEQ